MQGMFGSVEFSFAVFGDNFKMRVANVVSFFFFSSNVQLLGCWYRRGGDLSLSGLELFQGSMTAGQRGVRELRMLINLINSV